MSWIVVLKGCECLCFVCDRLSRKNGKIELLTKGDNNRVGDRGLYAPGQLWLNREDILGRAAG